MAWLHRPLAVNAVQLLSCEPDEDGLTNQIRMRVSDGAELCLSMPTDVAAELRASLDRALRDVDQPAFRTFRGDDEEKDTAKVGNLKRRIS